MCVMLVGNYEEEMKTAAVVDKSCSGKKVGVQVYLSRDLSDRLSDSESDSFLASLSSSFLLGRRLLLAHSIVN